MHAPSDPPASLEELRESLAAKEALRAVHDRGERRPVYDEVVLDEELGPVAVRVDEAAVKAMAFALDDHRPWHFGPSPFGGPVGHAAALANELLCIYYTHYDRHGVVGLHTEELMEFHSPVRVGETATLTGRYVDKYERRGRGYVDLVAEARGEDGRLLVHHRGVEIMRIDPGDVVSEPTGDADAPPPAAPGSGRIDASFDRDAAPVPRAAPGLTAGAPLVPRRSLLSADMISVFSFGGEFLRNIHTDLEIARGGGLERPIAQGQQQASLLASYATDLFGASWFTSGRLRAKFVQPLPANSAITLGGRVAGYSEDGERLELELWLDRGDGVLSAVAWASALVEG